MRAGGTQAEYARVALADGTLVKTPAMPTEEQIPPPQDFSTPF